MSLWTQPNPNRPGYHLFNAATLKKTISEQPDRIIVGGLWKPEFVDLLALTLAKLKANNVRNVTVVGAVPRWIPSLPAAILKYQHKYQQQNKSVQLFPGYLSDPAHPEVKDIDQRMQDMALNAGYQYYSPFQYLCNETVGCLTNVSGELTQWDLAT